MKDATQPKQNGGALIGADSKTTTIKRNWGGSRAGAGRKKEDLMSLSVRMATQLVKEIDSIKGEGSRGAWLKAAIQEKLMRDKARIDSEERKQGL